MLVVGSHLDRGSSPIVFAFHDVCSNAQLTYADHSMPYLPYTSPMHVSYIS